MLNTELRTVIPKFLSFCNANTYVTYNFTLAPDPKGTIFTVENLSSKYKKDYIKYSECLLKDFQKHVPNQFITILNKYFKEYLIYMVLEIGKNGLRHYHGQIISTEPCLSPTYLQDLIGNIAFKFTSNFRSTQVLQQHPCIRIYIDKGDYVPQGEYPTYIDYCCKTADEYHIDSLFSSKYYQERWMKTKHLSSEKIYIKDLLKFMLNSNLSVKNSNIEKIRKCYTNKKSQEMETLINLKKMFGNAINIKIEINTDDLDKII